MGVLEGLLSKRERETIERDKMNRMYYSADYRDEWCKGNDFVNEMQTEVQLFNDSYHLELGRDSYND